MSNWTVSRLEDGSYKAILPARVGRNGHSYEEVIVEQPLLNGHDYLTQKAFARAIMLTDSGASCEGLPEISSLLDRLRGEGFNQ